MIRAIIKEQLSKIYDADIRLEKKGSKGNYMNYMVTPRQHPLLGKSLHPKEPIKVRVEIDNEDHDWWVEEYQNNRTWKRTNIITI